MQRRQPSFSRREGALFSIKVFDQDRNADGGYDSAIDEDTQPYYMKLFNKDKHEVAQLKCFELQPLKNLRDQIVSCPP